MRSVCYIMEDQVYLLSEWNCTYVVKKKKKRKLNQDLICILYVENNYLFYVIDL